MSIEADEEAGWYIVQCIAGTETNVMSQLKDVVPKTPGAMDSIEKFCVPTRLAGNSRMSKVFTTEQVLYPSYIFVNMKLNSLTYTAITCVQRVSSFVGTRKPIGRGSLSMVVPLRLSLAEVDRFEGLAAAGATTSEKDKWAFEYAIGDMVKVLSGDLKDETGAVRQVRDGNLVCRFWTYGSQLDVRMDPQDVRKLSVEEVEKGLEGPQVPLGQDDIDKALGRPPRPKRGEQGQRGDRGERGENDLRVKGSREVRNRREDREGRGERDRNWIDPVQERDNWESYKKKERRTDDRDGNKGADWEIFQGMSKKGGEEKTEEEKNDEDDFFKDLMEELNESLNDEGETEPLKEEQQKQSEKQDLTKLTVPKLKDICRDRGLKVGGTKKELIERINA